MPGVEKLAVGHPADGLIEFLASQPDASMVAAHAARLTTQMLGTPAWVAVADDALWLARDGQGAEVVLPEGAQDLVVAGQLVGRVGGLPDGSDAWKTVLALTLHTWQRERDFKRLQLDHDRAVLAQRRTACLHVLSSQAAHTGSLAEAAQVVLATAMDALQATGGVLVWLAGPAGMQALATRGEVDAELLACVEDPTSRSLTCALRAEALAVGEQSSMVMPFCLNQQVLGVLAMARIGPREQADPAELAFLTLFAEEAARALFHVHRRAIEQRNEAEAQRSRDQIATVLSGMRDAVVAVDTRGAIVFMNQIAMRWLPTGVFSQADVTAVFAILEPLLAATMIGQASTTEHDLAFADGHSRYVQVSCVPRREGDGPVEGAVLVMTDLTDRRRAEEQLQRTEEQLRHSQKMDAVGRLAGGIAHDFNNLLTAINGYCDLILAVMRTDEPFRAHVEEIRRAGERAAALTGQLLAFSHQRDCSPRVLDLNVVVKDLERMLRHLIGEDVVLSTDLRAPQAWVRVDPSHVEQVLLNLILNARDAMPEGGRIAVETEVVEVAATDAAGYLSPAPGQYVRLTVRDTGTGISPEALPHLFEPYFSTKGKALGLGLSTVYGIVRQGHGGLRVSSIPGQGAAVEVLLPLTQPEARLSADRTNRERPALPGGSERVLLVEDEASVRRLVALDAPAAIPAPA